MGTGNRSRLPVPLSLPLILLLLIAASLYIAPRARLDADEGFYGAAALRAMEGDLPYRDFGYTQTPLLPYLHGPVLKVVGFGFLEQRYLNAVWLLLTGLAIFYLGRLLGGSRLALLALFATAASSRWVWASTLGKAYGAVGFFMVLAAIALVAPWRPRGRVALFAVAATLAAGCRLTVAPALLVMWLLLIFRERGRGRALAAGLPPLIGIVAMLPFYLASPGNFVFWNLEFHFAQTIVRRGMDPVIELARLSPGAMLLLLAAIVLLLVRPRLVKARAFPILSAAVVGVGVHLGLKYSYGQYSTPYIPLLIVASMALLAELPRLRKLGWLLLLFPALNLLDARPPWDEHPQAIAETAAFLEANTPEGGMLLTPFPILALESGRRITPGLEMGKFAVTTEMTREEADRRHLATPEGLAESLARREAAAVVLNNFPSAWNFSWSVPSFTAADPARMREFYNQLARHYRPAFERDPFIVLLPRETP